MGGGFLHDWAFKWEHIKRQSTGHHDGTLNNDNLSFNSQRSLSRREDIKSMTGVLKPRALKIPRTKWVSDSYRLPEGRADFPLYDPVWGALCTQAGTRQKHKFLLQPLVKGCEGHNQVLSYQLSTGVTGWGLDYPPTPPPETQQVSVSPLF